MSDTNTYPCLNAKREEVVMLYWLLFKKTESPICDNFNAWAIYIIIKDKMRYYNFSAEFSRN